MSHPRTDQDGQDTGTPVPSPSLPSPALPPSLATARTVVQALVDGGVRLVVLAPGSRSAPFVPVLAQAQERGLLSVRVVLDERSAGFIALGAARAGLREGRRCPAAVITTSGTAVANLHPAVLEADAAGVPLLVLSADRPHELVGTGANQTTQQAGLLEPALRATVDLPADLPTDLGDEAAERALAGQVRRALAAATGRLDNDPGPAQVNVRLRPPLALPAGTALPALRVPRPGARVPASPTTSSSRVVAEPAPAPAPAADHARERGLLVLGDAPEPLSDLARGLASRLGWPLLAEPTSGAREVAGALPRYAELLGSPDGARIAARAEHVLVLGHPSLTRSVSALLARRDLVVDVLTTTARWTDTAGAAARVLPVVPGVTSADEVVVALGLAPAPASWGEGWREAVGALPPAGTGPESLSADTAALAVWRSCAGEGAPLLVIGSSMTVRRLDRLAPAGQEGACVRALANRGLAGIDGTLATALGVYLGAGEPVRAVVGDLTFLHDAMSLSRGRHEPEPDLQVVVLDDAGGGIFSTLEYPAVTAPEVMGRFFTTPQGADVAALAEALGARTDRLTDLPALERTLARPVRGLSVLHVRL